MTGRSKTCCAGGDGRKIRVFAETRRSLRGYTVTSRQPVLVRRTKCRRNPIQIQNLHCEGKAMGGRVLASARRMNCGVLPITLLLGDIGSPRLGAAQEPRPATKAA